MNDLTCIIIPVLVAVAIFVLISYRKQQAVDEAHTTYQDALRALKANPTSSDTRQHALSLGREYSNLTRNKKGVTLFDEMALMNDINAASAGAGIRATPVTPAAVASKASTASVEDRLKRLEELRNKGVINDQEWQERRQKILDEL